MLLVELHHKYCTCNNMIYTLYNTRQREVQGSHVYNLVHDHVNRTVIKSQINTPDSIRHSEVLYTHPLIASA